MPASQLRILAPLHHPAADGGLVRLAATLALRPGSELRFVHAVPEGSVPEPDAATGLERAATVARELGVTAQTHLESGTDVPTVVDQAIQRWRCNLLCMGWQADVQRDAVLSAPIRALAKSQAVDTVIFKDRGGLPARRILVPTGGGVHSVMSLQIAQELAHTWGSSLEVIRVARDPRCRPDDPRLHRYCAQIEEDARTQLQLLRIEAPLTVVASTEVVEPILERARDSDLVILGASNDWRQDEYLAGSIPDEIANRVGCSVLMVRSASAVERLPLSRIFWEHTIRLDLHPPDKWAAIEQLIEALVEARQIPASEQQSVLAAAVARERKLSTALGHQTAIPHAPIPRLPGIIGCLGVCPDGLDFEEPQGEPVRFVFLLLTPQQNYRLYIPVLSQIAGLIRADEARAAILACQTPAEVSALIKAAER
ncbi:MAG: PTS sugar transporter subunit IIA [Candidatus Latescibacterota bacterium]|jgi:mannitol/fructose-specific phosphotransferase system IIA component (Ntr-type)/nucleotide-binding universal stress UspA family protein